MHVAVRYLEELLAHLRRVAAKQREHRWTRIVSGVGSPGFEPIQNPPDSSPQRPKMSCDVRRDQHFQQTERPPLRMRAPGDGRSPSKSTLKTSVAPLADGSGERKGSPRRDSGRHGHRSLFGAECTARPFSKGGDRRASRPRKNSTQPSLPAVQDLAQERERSATVTFHLSMQACLWRERAAAGLCGLNPQRVAEVVGAPVSTSLSRQKRPDIVRVSADRVIAHR